MCCAKCPCGTFLGRVSFSENKVLKCMFDALFVDQAVFDI